MGTGGAFDVSDLRRYGRGPVRVTLADGAVWDGRLRTDLLTERSISIYLQGADGEGATLYIDQIAEIVSLPISAA